MAAHNILNLFPEGMREHFTIVSKHQDRVQEIRLRAQQPIYIIENNRERFLDRQGNYTDSAGEAKVLTIEELKRIVNHICQYSLYAYEDELRQGFLTVPGGHRVGIAGQAVLTAQDEVKTVKYISALNVRIAHEVKGAADKVMPYLYYNGKLKNVLIISPPGCGKTTILRDIVRQVSNGNRYGKGVSVGVVDERSEIAGCYHGCPQNDVGIRTDVLDSCPKARGMMMMIRSMAPGAMAIDELGEQEEWKSLLYASYCGTAILATMHGVGIEDYRLRSEICLPGHGDIFKIFIVLRRQEEKCVVEQVYEKENEGDFRCLFQR